MKKIIAIFLVSALFLTACGGGGNSANNSNNSNTNNSNTNNSSNSNTGSSSTNSSSSASASDDMNSIVRMTEDWPTFYDPGVGSSFSCTITQVNVYDSLVFPAPDGTVTPHIAKEWTVSDDGLTYTFKIRDDVKFHSGNILKASDVAYSMNRMLEIGEGYAYLYTGAVKECTAPDDTTVVMKLSAPFGPFVSTLIRLMIVEEALVTANYDKSQNTYGDKGDYGKTWMLTNDAGSGPYKTKEFKLDEYFLGEKFDDYFLGWEPDAPKYFKISNMTDPVAVRTAVANKELEITDELQPLENYNTMDGFPGVDLAAYKSGNMLSLCLNTKKAPTDDIHFRKAMAHILDYEAIVTSIYPGAGLANGPVASVVPGADASLKPYERNLELAKKELEQSKYYGNPDMMKITMTWCAEVPEQEKIALLLQSNLAELGIGIEITKKPFGSMIADAQTMETTPNASLVNFIPPYFEAGSSLKTRYHSSSCGSWEQMEWVQDPVLDKMIDDSLSITDRDERFKKYAEIQKYIYDLCPTVWVFNWIEKRAFQSGYMDWPVYDYVSEGKEYLMPMGFAQYARNMKVYTDKR